MSKNSKKPSQILWPSGLVVLPSWGRMFEPGARHRDYLFRHLEAPLYFFCFLFFFFFFFFFCSYFFSFLYIFFYTRQFSAFNSFTFLYISNIKIVKLASLSTLVVVSFGRALLGKRFGHAMLADSCESLKMRCYTSRPMGKLLWACTKRIKMH